MKVSLSPCLPVSPSGFTLIELVITVAVLAILTLGIVPLARVSVQRQKEQELRESLREMREAIDQFHREALAGAQMQANQQQGGTTGTTGGASGGRGTGGTGTGNGGTGGTQGPNPFSDPRVRVAITDQEIFTADNPDRFPPDLDTMVKGVNVLPIVAAGGLGQRGNLNVTATQAATQNSQVPKIKVYLRRIPVDPMTGKPDWCFTSSYDTPDTKCGSGGGENVFDVHSISTGTALNGEKYSDW
ncbi:MAG TPA: type II secretion system protein [Pyrinomonadaceae bacterium]|jgi:general secretion pathway protein G|nr:type II secretion system protein [Pyrinomonadaceae bacterium]